jgi:hypothetical protein
VRNWVVLSSRKIHWVACKAYTYLSAPSPVWSWLGLRASGQPRATSHETLTGQGEGNCLNSTKSSRALNWQVWLDVQLALERAWYFVTHFIVINVLKNIVSSSLKSQKSQAATVNRNPCQLIQAVWEGKLATALLPNEVRVRLVWRLDKHPFLPPIQPRPASPLLSLPWACN